MKKLILTVGLPQSGKTTWAQAQCYCPIVSPDSIRLAMHGQRFQFLAEPFVWATALVMVRALFLAGHDTVIVDATHTTKKRRDFWKSDNDWEVWFQPIGTPKEVCLQRAERNKDTEIIPIIEKMAARFEPLDSEEQKRV